ncbi:hypothetical protein Q4F19_17400 [Sphingomonas sp. BIUV-7]|uniref:Glycoside hydrolase family 5 domain-containing protein n=1 Tax=Sphingomonas natans TaxID=3063330 RepID=A0ABT8YCT0_9SPHN|nr:hypothetical protein [Sphingomonas sp. BIUV-7]MDO6416166.1 hypothetical protein [Sphingomonas sp. BIUV-7]
MRRKSAALAVFFAIALLVRDRQADWAVLSSLTASVGLAGKRAAVAAESAASRPLPLVVGVATHFDQGWPLDLVRRTRDLQIGIIRDDLPWGKGEPEPGRYDFDGGSAAYVAQSCGQGLKLLLMIDPHHAAYDKGATAHTPAAQRAYADYLNAVLDRFGSGCIEAIEVGNEINAGDSRLPAGVTVASAHTSLLKTVASVVKPRYPDVQILAGSSNMVATGFEDTLFAQGVLDSADGIAVHPYRDHPEGLEVELPRLRAAMHRHGRVRPIWATETGDEVDDPRMSASLMIRMLCLIAAEPDVAGLFWYALIDEPYFRNTGLLDSEARTKPAGEAMLAAKRLLLAHGRPVRVGARDRRNYVYRFGAQTYVIWGVPRPIHVEGNARNFDVRGQRLVGPLVAGPDPIIVTGADRVTLGASQVMADSLYQYAGPPWSYLARRATGQTVPLKIIDWNWTSYWGDLDLRPLAIGEASATPAGEGSNPLAATVRYTASVTTPASISACFTTGSHNDGLSIEIRHNNRVIHQAILTDRLEVKALPVTLKTGDRLDVAFGPNKVFDGDALTYRIRILALGAKTQEHASCA